MNTSSTPLVSVLMTAYNREKYIEDAIQSVLTSSYTHFELIIVDDCSHDQTYAIAKKYELKDSRIKVYRNDHNLSQFVNRNKAATYAQGTFIKYLDSDDIMYPHCLDVMINAMLQYPEAAIVSETNSKLVDEVFPHIYSPRESYINHFFKGNSILYEGPSGCMFKRDIFMQFGGFNEEIGILADTLLMLKIAAKFAVIGVRDTLFYWRRHEEQVTVGQLNKLEMMKQRFEINKIILNSNNFPLTSHEQKIVSRNIKNIFIRRMLKNLISKPTNFRDFYKLTTFSNVKITDFIKAAFKNKRILT